MITFRDWKWTRRGIVYSPDSPESARLAAVQAAWDFAQGSTKGVLYLTDAPLVVKGIFIALYPEISVPGVHVGILVQPWSAKPFPMYEDAYDLIVVDIAGGMELRRVPADYSTLTVLPSGQSRSATTSEGIPLPALQVLEADAIFEAFDGGLVKVKKHRTRQAFDEDIRYRTNISSKPLRARAKSANFALGGSPKITYMAYLVGHMNILDTPPKMNTAAIYSSQASGITVAMNRDHPVDIFSVGGDSYQEARDKLIWYLASPNSHLGWVLPLLGNRDRLDIEAAKAAAKAAPNTVDVEEAIDGMGLDDGSGTPLEVTPAMTGEDVIHLLDDLMALGPKGYGPESLNLPTEDKTLKNPNPRLDRKGLQALMLALGTNLPGLDRDLDEFVKQIASEP